MTLEDVPDSWNRDQEPPVMSLTLLFMWKRIEVDSFTQLRDISMTNVTKLDINVTDKHANNYTNTV